MPAAYAPLPARRSPGASGDSGGETAVTCACDVLPVGLTPMDVGGPRGRIACGNVVGAVVRGFRPVVPMGPVVCTAIIVAAESELSTEAPLPANAS